MLNNVNTKILIAEDNKHTQELLVSLLSGDGYDIVGRASDGREAMDKFEILSPDIVTMDLDMPIMNGLQATESIISKHPGAKIIVVSGFSDAEAKALELGAVAFVSKPFNPRHLLEVVGKVARHETLEPTKNQTVSPVVQEPLSVFEDTSINSDEKNLNEEEDLFFFTETTPTKSTEINISKETYQEVLVEPKPEELHLFLDVIDENDSDKTKESFFLIEDSKAEVREDLPILDPHKETYENEVREEVLNDLFKTEPKLETSISDVSDDDEEDDLLSGRPVKKQVTNKIQEIHKETYQEATPIEISEPVDEFFNIEISETEPTMTVEPIYIPPRPLIPEEPLIIKPPKGKEVLETETSDYFEIEAWKEPEVEVGLLGKILNKIKKKRGNEK